MEFFNNTYMKFPHKNYGRIFVENKEDINALHQIIKEMDDFEYSYLPDDLIAVFSDENMRSVYTHKFDDMNMTEVMYRAWSMGIKCFCVFGKISGYEDF
jgi:hypothetical protein